MKEAEKPKLSFWQIWNLSFGFLGIQFGFALQNANVSRIFETLGAKADQIPMLWLAAPVTGLIVQPIIGYFSDRTWHPVLGRRRPYFLFGAILASLALIAMPNSPILLIAAGILWIMDASINISMEPFRAFVGDLLPSEQRTRGFALQSFFIGTGAVVASLLPWVMTNWFHLDNTAPPSQVPPSVKWSFYIGAFAFFSAVLWTVLKTKEYPPDENEEKAFADRPLVIKHPPSKYMLSGIILLVISLAFTLYVKSYDLAAQLYVLGGILALFGFAYLLAGFLMSKNVYRNGFVQIVRDFQNMPKTMVQLAYVQFFSWFSLFAMWIYTTPAVTAHVYGAVDTTSKLYNNGADWVGVCFAVYNGVAAVYAFFITPIAKKTSRRFTHFISLGMGGLGLISIFFIKDPMWLLVSMIGVGIAWASVLSVPYAMLAGCLPPRKMGYYMGIFNFFIVIPQIVAASVLGFLVKKFFQDDAIYALIIGGICMIFSGVLTLRVRDNDDIRLPIPNE